MRQNRIRLCIAILTVIGIGCLIMGCGASESDDQNEIYVGIACYDQGDIFISNLIQCFKNELNSQKGDSYDVMVTVRDAVGSQKTQNDQVKEMIDEGCNILCINLVDRTDPSEIIDCAKEKNIPILAFLHQNPGNIISTKSENNDYRREKLATFRKSVENSGIHVNYYDNENDLKYKIAKSITKTISDYPAIGWVRADQVEKLLEESEYIPSIRELQQNLAQMQNILSEKIERTVPTWEPISTEDIENLF